MQAESVHISSLGSQGPHFVMLHGWGRSSMSLKALGDLFSRDYQVHLVDLPGFGRAPIPEEVWGAHDYARVVLKALSIRGIDRFTLLGHSFGGKVAICMAAQAPAQVERLVLIAASGLPRHRGFKDRVRMQGIRFLSKFIRRYDQLTGSQVFEDRFVPRFASADYRNAGPMRPILVKAVNEAVAEQLPRIQAPTLLIWGDQDMETPPDIGERMAASILQSQLLVLPGKGHEPFAGGGAQLCAYHLKSFLQREGQPC